MKKILFLSLLLISIESIGQIPYASYTNKGATVPFIDASYYKLNGIPLDTANTTRRGFLTPFQYNYIHSITSSRWTASSSNIYYSAGAVGIGAAPTSGSTLYLKATEPVLRMVYTGSANEFNISVNSSDNLVFGGTLPTQRIKFSQKLLTTNIDGYLTQQGIYAGIYVADASTAQSIASGATYTKSTAFTTNGLDENCTADAANDKITITKAGKYMVMGTCSFTSGTNSVVWYSAAFLDGTELPNIHWARKVGTGSDVGSASFMGIINVTSVPVDLDVRFRQDQAGAINITVVYSNLTVNYIGE